MAEQSAEAKLGQLNLDIGDEEETESPPEVVEEAVETPPPETSSRVAAELRKWGYEIDSDATDDDVREYLESRESAGEQLQTLQQERDQLQQELEQFRAQASQPPTQETTQEPDHETDEFPKPPQLDGSVRDILTAALQSETPMVRQSAGGFLTAVDATMQPFVQKYNEYVQAEKEYRRPFEEDPYAFVSSHIEKQRNKFLDPVQKELESVKQELAALKHARSQESQDAFWEKHADHFFQKDAEGNFVVENGRYAGTEAWTVYEQSLAEAERYGVPEANRHAYAAEKALAFTPPEDTPKKKRMKFRNRVRERIDQSPVNRPAASPDSKINGQNITQKLGNYFSALMDEGVAERV